MTSLYAPRMEDAKGRLRPFGIFFEKTLKDLIKGIRTNNTTPEKLQNFLTQALSECREEAASTDLNMKTNAVLKLTYLEMYGFDMSWANFHILEVMSSNKLQQKRVGYLAASQSFYKDPEILMLATNLMRKDLKYGGNHDVVKVGIALSGLSTIVTSSLAMDICDDLFVMLTSSRAYIRKKAIAALFKVFLQYPEALRDNFDKFVSKLEDDDTSVVSAAVSVVCELSKMNPAPFVVLSPLLYGILVSISNNWIIIRLLKLFTNLSKVEPKLRPKLLPKILELMDSTVATSVLYESINCIVKGNILDKDDYDTAMICLDRLHAFCDSSDPNLRYISCVLFYKIGKINTDFISKFDKLVFRLLNDVDVSIRSKAVELIEGIVNGNNLKNLVTTLLKQFVNEDVVLLQSDSTGIESREIPIVIPESYKVKLVHTIIRICSMDNFIHMTDFEWFNAVLWDISVLASDLPDKALGFKIGEQLRNIMVKVPSMRDSTLSTIIKVISYGNISNNLPSLLKDCFWSLGEFSNHIDNGDDLLELMINREHLYPPEIQKVIIPAILKVFTNWCNSAPNPNIERIEFILNGLLKYFESFTYSKYFDVQERAVESVELLKLVLEALKEDDEGLPLLITDVLPSLFNSYELKPISHGTQQKLQNTLTVDCQTPFLTEAEFQAILDQEESNIDDGSYSDKSLALDDEDYYENEDTRNERHSISSAFKEAETESDPFMKEEKESNPFYLADENEEKNNVADLLDFTDSKNTPESSVFISLTKHDSPQKTNESISKGEKKKKKKKSTTKVKKRVEIIPDEIVTDNELLATQQSNPNLITSNNSSSTINSYKGKINLKTNTKLANFDFFKRNDTDSLSPSNIDAEAGVEDQIELEKLRSRFGNQSLGHTQAGEGEEVIVIKKKKKSAKKKKTSRKKKNAVEEGDSAIGSL